MKPLLLLLLLLTTTSSPLASARTIQLTAEEEAQDVFLQCLNSLYHADANGDNQLNRVEFRSFATDYASQLYAHPLFEVGSNPAQGYLTNEMRDLFKLLMQATGGDPYKGGYSEQVILIKGNRVEDLMHIDALQFDRLHKLCSLTQQAFALLAKKTKAPKTMVMEFTMVEGEENHPFMNPGQEEITVKIKPLLEVDKTQQQQAEQTPAPSPPSTGPFKELELHGTHLSFPNTETSHNAFDLRKQMNDHMFEVHDLALDQETQQEEEEDIPLEGDETIEEIWSEVIEEHEISPEPQPEPEQPPQPEQAEVAQEQEQEEQGDAQAIVFYPQPQPDNLEQLVPQQTEKQPQQMLHPEALPLEAPPPLPGNDNDKQPLPPPPIELAEGSLRNQPPNTESKEENTMLAGGAGFNANPTPGEKEEDEDKQEQQQEQHPIPNVTLDEVNNNSTINHETDSSEEDSIDDRAKQDLIQGINSLETKEKHHKQQQEEEEDEDFSFVWDEAYREQQYQKRKKELEDLKNALHQEKQALQQQEDHNQTSSSSKEEDSRESYSVNQGLIDAQQRSNKKHHDQLKQGEEPILDRYDNTTQNSYHDSYIANETTAQEKTTSHDEDEFIPDNTTIPVGGKTNESSTSESKDSLEDYADFFDDDDDDELSLDESGDDKQILSIHTSFIIFNFDHVTAKDVDISQDGTLDHAFADFVVFNMATVCDKAGIAHAFGNCTGILNTEGEKEEQALEKALEDEIDTAEEEGNSRRRRLGRTTRQQQRDLDGAEFYERKGVNFDFTVLNPELYDIEDMDECPMAAEFPSKSHPPVCQTVFAHFNLLLSGLDGNLNRIEHNYMVIIAKWIENGRLTDSLQMIDPQSIHHIEGVGVQAFPSLHPYHEDTTTTTSTGSSSSSEHDNVVKRHHQSGSNKKTKTTASKRVESDPDDPNWEALLAQEGYHNPNPAGLYAEDNLDQSIVGSVKVVKKGLNQHSGTQCKFGGWFPSTAAMMVVATTTLAAMLNLYL